MSEYNFTKLSNLVDSQFTINSIVKVSWKQWDNTVGKMLVSEHYVQGYRKTYTLDTDKGILDLSGSQLGNLFEAVNDKGRSDIVHKTFSVRSNGKTGMEIRYWFGVVKDTSDTTEYVPEELS